MGRATGASSTTERVLIDCTDDEVEVVIADTVGTRQFVESAADAGIEVLVIFAGSGVDANAQGVATDDIEAAKVLECKDIPSTERWDGGSSSVSGSEAISSRNSLSMTWSRFVSSLLLSGFKTYARCCAV